MPAKFMEKPAPSEDFVVAHLITSSFLNFRVADIQQCYRDWKAKGAQFITPPQERETEIRCYIRDPDGYLIEVGQSKAR